MSLHRTSISCKHKRYRYIYLCHYLPLSAGPDLLSLSLLRFKKGLQPDLDAWIDSCADLLAQAPPPPGTLILRALRHRETHVRPSQPPTPLDLLCQRIATQYDCNYHPELLRKSCSTGQIKGRTRRQRMAMLSSIYYLGNDLLQPAESCAHTALHTPATILLIDDILTTGATISTILPLLAAQYPSASIDVLTLARADRSVPNPLSGTPGTPSWEVAEEKAQYFLHTAGPLSDQKTKSNPSDWFSIDTLKHMIKKDIF